MQLIYLNAFILRSKLIFNSIIYARDAIMCNSFDLINLSSLELQATSYAMIPHYFMYNWCKFMGVTTTHAGGAKRSTNIYVAVPI